MSGFQTTCWTLVLAAGSAGERTREEALNRLCSLYWPPVFDYIRRNGKREEESRDLTQEFFARLLEKHWLETAAQERGKFRTFMLTMLKRFLANDHRAESRLKRGGGMAALSLDWEDAPEFPDTAESPDRAFDRRWALTVMHRAAERLRKEAEASGRGRLFSAVSPWIGVDPAAGEYAEAGASLGMTKSAVAMCVHRLRLRLRALAREEVAETLADRGQVDEEMAELQAALRAGGSY